MFLRDSDAGVAQQYAHPLERHTRKQELDRECVTEAVRMAALDCCQLEKPAKATAPIAGRGILLAFAGLEKILLADRHRHRQKPSAH